MALVKASLQAVSSSAVVARNWCSRATQSSGGKISGLFAISGSIADHGLLGAGHRTDVVDPRLDHGRVLGLVVEVDPARGLRRVRRALGDDHVVRPEHPALLGQGPLEVLIRLLVGDEQAEDVAGPRHRQDRAAARHVLDVRVAGDLSDDAGRDGRLDGGEGRVELLLGERRGIAPQLDRRAARRCRASRRGTSADPCTDR